TISKEKLKELYANSKEETKASGGGFFRQMVNASKVLSEYADKVSSMDIEEIKKENTEVIKKSSIKKLRYRNYSEVVDMENNNTSKSEGKLVLVLDNKKMKFYHNYRDKNIKEYINKYLK
nr:hypothetical protein [Bacilli bacterium]